MKTLTELNVTLNKMSTNKRLVDTTRATIVNEIIALIIEEAKGHEFTNKRVAQKWIIEELLSDDNKNLDNYTKRALKVSKAILVDGYKIKKEALTIAQAENLIKSDKVEVNALMKYDSEIVDDKGETEYSAVCKMLINNRITNQAIAGLEEADATEAFKALENEFGANTRKILNLMIKAL